MTAPSKLWWVGMIPPFMLTVLAVLLTLTLRHIASPPTISFQSSEPSITNTLKQMRNLRESIGTADELHRIQEKKSGVMAVSRHYKLFLRNLTASPSLHLHKATKWNTINPPLDEYMIMPKSRGDQRFENNQECRSFTQLYWDLHRKMTAPGLKEGRRVLISSPERSGKLIIYSINIEDMLASCFHK